MVLPQDTSETWVEHRNRPLPIVEDRTSMHDAEVQHIQQIILRSVPSPDGHTRDQSLVSLALRAKYIREKLGLTDVAEDILQAVIALCVLGPTSANIPPQP